MKFRQIITVSFLLCSTLCAAVHAQVVDFPDPNLRTAIIDTLNLPRGPHLTEEHMHTITEFDVRNRGIYDLTGLEFAINLTFLRISDNPISDLRPIAGLTKLKTLIMEHVPNADINVLGGLINLEHFDISRCNVHNIDVVENFTQLVVLSISINSFVNISPLANLRTLRYIWAFNNNIVDIEPLSTLHSLRSLDIHNNNIVNIEPLSTLHNLRDLDIHGNQIIDHSPVDNLSLEHFRYDQTCDMPAVPLEPRLEKRTFPSIFTRWGTHIRNRPDLTRRESTALHDLWYDGSLFNLELQETPQGIRVAGIMDKAIRLRDAYLSANPDMVFIYDIRMRTYFCDAQPEDWPYWIRDTYGERIPQGPLFCLVDFTHPAMQDRIVQQAVALSKCGLYDGIFFDWWAEKWPVIVGRDSNSVHQVFRGLEAEQRARGNIVQRIRAATRSNFLIMGNVNIETLPRTAPYVNGGAMETVMPADRDSIVQIEKDMNKIRESLLWLDQNLREPQINGLEGWSVPSEPPDSPTNLRWMRAMTTLSLTHSNGYVVYKDIINDHHHWYDFWDADLGRPLGEKGDLYQETEGLYIREFTNGWAVYNHSGEQQVVNLPEKVQGVSSNWVGTTHVLPNLDGEMYLRVKPAYPADVNGDGVVNILDLVAVAQAFGKDGLQGDVNADGLVNVFDLVFVAGAIGGGGAAPSAYSLDPSIISAADVARWLAGAQGLGVGDANFQRGIRFLQKMLAASTPKETALLPNYPNPFNPETWMPYRLAREAEVAITIYDTKGTPVRRLALGNQAAGYYAERGKAAYWDGRNEDGEAVASGIYIYQFRAGDYAASRRMVIVK